MASKSEILKSILRPKDGRDDAVVGSISSTRAEISAEKFDWESFRRRIIDSGPGTKREFLKAFLRNKGQVGAVVPSSAQLAEMMVDWFDWDNIQSVIEYGPGTGVFTEKIESRRHPETRFFAIEMDPGLADITRRRCPEVLVHNDSVTNVRSICAEASMTSVDAILSGLPWASFPDSLQDECFDAMFEILPPGGKFATFAYWQGLMLPAGQRFRRKLKERFSEVHFSQTAWSNLPPAFVYRCVR